MRDILSCHWKIIQKQRDRSSLFILSPMSAIVYLFVFGDVDGNRGRVYDKGRNEVL